MRTVTGLLLVALLVASACAECVNRVSEDSYVGDHSVFDSALSCNQQAVALPATSIAGHDATTFEVEVYLTAFGGAVFSFGETTNDHVTLYTTPDSNGKGQVNFAINGATVSSGGVLTLNEWHNVAVIVKNKANQRASVSISVDAIPAASSTDVPAITSAPKVGYLGTAKVEGSQMRGALDNLIISAKAKTAQELADTHALIYPFVLENDLIQMWTFNDEGESTAAYLGAASKTLAVASLKATGSCTRVPKVQFKGARTTDVLCSHSGSVKITNNDVNNLQSSSFFQSGEGGLTQAFACANGDLFTFNQKWANGAITQMTVKTSLNHRFRITANPDSAMIVEHQAWGGWTRIASGSGIIYEDRSAYSISETQFVIQAAGIGWIEITQTGALLNYKFALAKAACPATCNYLEIDNGKFELNNPPLPEPMGNQQTAQGFAGSAPVLACPTPKLNGYNPFMYCWGWWVGPQVGYVKDWNGNTWQTSDPGCCHNTAVLSGNQWTLNNWGKLIKGQTLFWCDNFVAPPIDPPKPETPPPVWTEDPCEGVEASEKSGYIATCTNLWGANQQDGRFLSCLGQLCKTKNPATLPTPDCRTEKLLEKLDSNYHAPTTCNSCPNNCNFKGTCNTQTLKCDTCNPGWIGPDCGQPTSYTCIVTGSNTLGADNDRIMPKQLFQIDEAFNKVPVLSSQMIDAFHTQTQWDTYAVADSLVIYIASSVADFNSDVTTYHLMAVSNNAAGSKAADYEVQITALTGSIATGSQPDPSFYRQLDLFGGAKADADTNQYGQVYPEFERTIVGVNPLRINIKHGAGAKQGFAIRNLPNPVDLKIRVTGSAVPSQIFVAGASASAKAALDFIKIGNAVATSTNGFHIGGNGVGKNFKCVNTECAAFDCATCATQANCGYCIDSAQCMPGDAAGPAFGECLNWRKTFSTSVTRRVTQVPAYPVNPGLTEVFVATASSVNVDLYLSPFDYANSEWDMVILNDWASASHGQGAFAGQIQSFLTAASGYPNAGVAFLALTANKYNLVLPITNPRDTDGIPDVLSALTPAAVSQIDVVGAINKLANEDSINLRRGTRGLALFMISGDHNSPASSFASDTAEKLLTKNLIPVFAVPANKMASYRNLVATLGYGYVIEMTPNSLADVLRTGLRAAGSSVAVTVLAGEQTNTHVNYAAMTAGGIDRFVAANLPTNVRAKFSLPVVPFSGANLNAVTSTHLYLPGYGSAVIENIPADKAERPWTVTDKYGFVSVMDNAPATLIELSGMSFRGLLSVTPTITSLPANLATFGALRRAVQQNVNGVPTWVASGDDVVVGQVIADNQIVFVPKAGASGSFSFTYKVGDTCQQLSDDGTITIEVTRTNTPPVADMPNLVTEQNTALEFDLLFGDDAKLSGDEYTFTIIDTVETDADDANAGLYHFYPGYDSSAMDQNERVAVNTPFGEARLIYVPPKYKYSEGLGKLRVWPCFTYSVHEESTPEAYTSNVKLVVITVLHVNNPPFVWGDAAWPSALLGAWSTPNTDVCSGTNADGSVSDACKFMEDFNQPYWWQAGFEYIYLGGNDIEGSKLTYLLTEVNCYPGTLIFLPLDSSRNAAAGDKIHENNAGELKATLRFRPAPESHNGLLAAAGMTDYCTIKYKVIDEEGADSLTTKTIKISVQQVNKQPHLDDTEVRVVALEQQEHQFYLPIIDPEGDAFTVKFRGCAQNAGLITICKKFDCLASERITIPCENTYDPLGTYSLDLTALGLDLSPVPATGQVPPLQGFFTSGPVDLNGKDYNAIYLEISDGVSTFPHTQGKIIFDVKILNIAPVVLVQGSDVDEFSATTRVEFDYTPGVSIFDQDFINSDFYLMTAEVVFDRTGASNSKLNVAEIQGAVANLPESCQATVVITEEKVAATCAINPLNIFLSTIKIVAPITLAEGEDGVVSLKVTANDNGFVGQCDVPYLTNDPCILEDVAVVKVKFEVVTDGNMATIASSAAAAGVAGAAAIAAVALFRRFNQKAAESYAPWDDSQDESTAVNPLYQESGSKGTNPLFQAQNNDL